MGQVKRGDGIKGDQCGEEVVISASDIGLKRRSRYTGRGGRSGGWNGKCLLVASLPQSMGGRPAAMNEEAVVEVWNSYCGNWRKMLTQDKLRTAVQC